MIRYLIGDATRPQANAPWVLAHVCNDAGGWGAGFSGPLSLRWPGPEEQYRSLELRRKQRVDRPRWWMGHTQWIEVAPSCFVANMIAQHGFGRDRRLRLDYESLRLCLLDVAQKAARTPGVSVHMPRIGCGLAGGRWEEVAPIIAETLSDFDVFVYDLPSNMRGAQ